MGLLNTTETGQSYANSRFWVESVWRLLDGHARPNAKGALTRSSPIDQGAVPAGSIGLFPAPSPKESTRPERS